MSLQDKASIVLPKGFAGKAGTLECWNPNTDSLVGLSVVRATTATRVNESGLIESVSANVPRRDFLNGGCGELLIEPQRTNITTYSNTFDFTASGGDWSNNDVTITSDSGASPFSGENADLIIENNDVSQIHRVNQLGTTISSGVDYVYSFYAKANGRNFVILRSGITGSTVNNSFDISSGSVVSTGAGFTLSIEDAGDGWYRCIAKATSGVTSTEFQLILSDNGTNLAYNGDGSSGVYLIGAQLEQGSYATSIIPTTTAAVTRNADVIAGTGLAALLGDAVGGIYVDAKPFVLSGVQSFTLSNGTNDNRAQLYFTATQIGFDVESGNVIQCSITGGSPSASVFNKICARYSVNDFTVHLNGSRVAQETSGITFPDATLTEFSFASATGASSQFYGRVKELVIFNNVPTESQANSITTP